MATKASHNKNSSAVKRIMSEARELQNDDSTDYSAGPLEHDIFEWHCTIRGPPDTEFEGGLYHCRISLPSEYPFKAPSIMVLTPNGRFELNKKICISFTSYHEELWQPAWGVRTAIIGLQGFFPLKGEAAIGVGAVEYPIAERKRLATLSRTWTCPDCGVPNIELLPDPPTGAVPSTSSSAASEESKQETDRSEQPAALSTPPKTTLPIMEVITESPPAIVSNPESFDTNHTPSTSTATTTQLAPQQPPPPSTSSRPPERVVIGTIAQPKVRPPLWLDATIVVFSVLIVFMAGKRFTNLWDLVTDDV